VSWGAWESSPPDDQFPFPFLQMGGSPTVPVSHGIPFPPTCLLRHWKNLDSESLRKKILIVYCIQAWPKYPLGDQEC
jgi:hypothetical protein